MDRQLLDQMKDLIRKTADKNSFSRLSEWNCLLKEKEVKSRIEEPYNLKYPGKVLERYEERCGGGKSQTLALVLALAETRPVLDQAMFVGTQYMDFIRKVRRQAEEEFCLSCFGRQEWCAAYSWMETDQFTLLFGASMLDHNGSNMQHFICSVRTGYP